MSERTAEHVIIPDLMRKLQGIGVNSMPLYFLSTREGNKTSCSSMNHFKSKLVTIFPRRPKLFGNESSFIAMKINGHLLDYANKSSAFQIPVIAGMPLVMSISQLNPKTSCIWMSLHSEHDENEDQTYKVSLVGDIQIIPEDASSTCKFLAEQDIAKIIEKQISYRWRELCDLLKEIRLSQPSGYPHGNVYRPIHLIIAE